MPVTDLHIEHVTPLNDHPRTRAVTALRCQGCRKFILGFVYWQGHSNWASSPAAIKYETHYPISLPSDDLPTGIPDAIAHNFKEALRCRWIKAYQATVLMCRRALQVSCDSESAVGNDMYKQIDDLASKQLITEPLRKMAHRIRLLGKRGAHGDYSDIDATITQKDADDAIKFMGHYLEHVYVLPAELAP